MNERWGKTDELVIMAFPSREFGAQEYQTDEEIQQFVYEKQQFHGLLMKLGKVCGNDAPAIWKYMKDETGAKDPTWNFSWVNF